MNCFDQCSQSHRDFVASSLCRAFGQVSQPGGWGRHSRLGSGKEVRGMGPLRLKHRLSQSNLLKTVKNLCSTCSQSQDSFTVWLTVLLWAHNPR